MPIYSTFTYPLRNPFSSHKTHHGTFSQKDASKRRGMKQGVVSGQRQGGGNLPRNYYLQLSNQNCLDGIAGWPAAISSWPRRWALRWRSEWRATRQVAWGSALTSGMSLGCCSPFSVFGIAAAVTWSPTPSLTHLSFQRELGKHED